MICSNKSKIVKRIFLQEVNNIKRYYASTIQLPFHPHYVPPGQPTTITTTSDIWKQNKISKTSRFVPTINRLQEASFSKREDIFLSMNFFGDTYNETSKRKIPFIFRISTICFIKIRDNLIFFDLASINICMNSPIPTLKSISKISNK
ncbi:hypothetical protein GLOIN_2v1560768 [Rhizophagus irregularis DAOM 181602=DAOM 197198]|nr:hypothetical protein GLOIN_2v1560768 [Rhizophagus irregularis DAOM 181602=DAOM 197198]